MCVHIWDIATVVLDVCYCHMFFILLLLVRTFGSRCGVVCVSWRGGNNLPPNALSRLLSFNDFFSSSVQFRSYDLFTTHSVDYFVELLCVACLDILRGRHRCCCCFFVVCVALIFFNIIEFFIICPIWRISYISVYL